MPEIGWTDQQLEGGCIGAQAPFIIQIPLGIAPTVKGLFRQAGGICPEACGGDRLKAGFGAENRTPKGGFLLDRLKVG